MNLPEILDPSKGQGRALYIGLIIALVGVSAFFLGRLSVLMESQGGINIVGERVSVSALEAAHSLSSTTAPNTEGAEHTVRAGAVVASKKGRKYHYPWCAGAQAISEENKVWFDSVKAAQVAGYEPAGNCKGLQ